MLKREPRFALICQMAEEQYAYLYKPSGQPEKEDAGEKADTAGEEQDVYKRQDLEESFTDELIDEMLYGGLQNG